MAWVKCIVLDAFSEALGHLKFYICRLGGGLACGGEGELGGWADEWAIGWTAGRTGERESWWMGGWADRRREGGGPTGWVGGRMGERAGEGIDGYHMACC